ncbi:transferase [Luteimonas pelagia]
MAGSGQDDGRGGGWLAWLARWWRGADGAQVPMVRRRWNTTELQFARGVSQSRMLTSHPDRLLIDYTRTMMGVLLFQPRPASIGIVGLGGGSQAKFCHRELPAARIEAIEVDPRVVALRDRFRIPADDARFQVRVDDAVRVLPTRRGAYDLLLVDAYDASGIPAALSTTGWYRACRDALAEGGAASFNLYGDDADGHVGRLREAFGERMVVLSERRQSNRIAFGWRGDPLPSGRLDRLRPPADLSGEARTMLEPVFARLGRTLQAQREAARR